VVGVDLSDKAIAVATDLATQTGVDTTFVCCDIYDLPNHLDRKFDIVFTSYGTVGWLPDLDKWAGVIAKFLAPTGKFVIVDFHPVVWMLDDDFRDIKYSYFNTGPIREQISGTYADRDASLTQDYIEWNHSLSEILNALIASGLQIELLNEYDYSPHDCFKHTIEFSPGRFRIEHLEDKIPLTFAVVATA
jgi:SAM-dependent methyltransferase